MELPYVFSLFLLDELHRAGFSEAEISPGNQFISPVLNPNILMSESGVWLGKEHEPTPDILTLLNKLHDILDVALEASYLDENAPRMTEQSMTDYQKYAEYKDILFTARPGTKGSLQYVVWKRIGKDEFENAYSTTDNFSQAKQDFLIRSGLLSRQNYFQSEQFKDIHHALVYRALHDDGLDLKDEYRLRQLIEKLEKMSPDLKDTLEAPAQENEPEPEQ